MKIEYQFAIIGAALLAGACAGAPKPTDQLVQTRAALRAADEVGAAEVPQAQLHVQLAQEQLQRADKLLDDGDNEEAARVLTRAKADAELAVALTRQSDAEQAVEKLQPDSAPPNRQPVSMNQ